MDQDPDIDSTYSKDDSYTGWNRWRKYSKIVHILKQLFFGGFDDTSPIMIKSQIKRKKNNICYEIWKTFVEK